jgi:hypothetical protein
MRKLARFVVAALFPLAAGCGSGASSSADAGRSCQQLVSDFEAARSAALACTPGAANQCQALVPVSMCAGCGVYVNDATQASAISAQFFDQGCDKNAATACTPFSCIQVGPSSCVANDGGSPGGTCTPMPPR